MALSATLHSVALQLSDVDRGVYQTLELKLARHPSETAEFMLTRLLAYGLEYREGIAFTEGVAAVDEPAVLVRDLTGRITAWIEVGAPDAARLHRGMKHAGCAAVYTHRPAALLLAQFAGQKIHRPAEIPLYAPVPEFIKSAAAALDRRHSAGLSVTEPQTLPDINGSGFSAAIAGHRPA